MNVLNISPTTNARKYCMSNSRLNIYAQYYDMTQVPGRGPRPVASSWSKPAARSFSSCFALASFGKYIFRNLSKASSMFSTSQ